MGHAAPSISFTGLVDLASAAVGGQALECTDDFFAPMSALVDPRPAVFDPDAYTDRGKLMDGWESRRKRVPGHDWCVVRLGVPGVIRALDVDTSFFLGNHPPFCSLEAKSGEGGEWTEVLPQSPLRPGSSNLFAIAGAKSYTHVRLHIFPDGGVARLRVYGDPEPRWDAPSYDEATEPHVKGDEVDLAALVNGGKALACSDAFFGPMNNLLAPGRAANMGGGWETRRKRAPGDDWILVRLGAAGTLSVVELDTNHFKGNYPDRASLEGISAPSARITELIASSDWKEVLPESKLAADTRHFFRAAGGPYTHLRLRIFPDGGVSRLRAWGRRA